MNIMLDLETLSSRPDACIVAIGATRFSSDGSNLDEPGRGHRLKFYVAIDPRSAQDAGGRVDASTVQWWLNQSPEARAVFSDASPMPIAEALNRFAEFCSQPYGPPIVWGNGASFDNIVLRQAYERVGLEAPWSYRNERCYRTLKSLRPDIPFEPVGTAHHALDDAIAQARHAERLIAALGIVTP